MRGRWGWGWREKTLRDHVDSERFGRREVRVRRVGGGGKVMVGSCAVVAAAVLEDEEDEEERCRCKRSTNMPVMSVSSTYKLGSAFTGPAYTLSFLDDRSRTKRGVRPPVSGAAKTIFSALRELGVMEMGKVVLALSRRVGWMR